MSVLKTLLLVNVIVSVGSVLVAIFAATKSTVEKRLFSKSVVPTAVANVYIT